MYTLKNHANQDMKMYFGDTLALDWEGCPELYDDEEEDEEFINFRKESLKFTQDETEQGSFFKNLQRTDVLPRTYSYTSSNKNIEFTY